MQVNHVRVSGGWRAHLFFVLFQLLLQFLVLALAVFNLFPHFNILKIQLGELLLLGLNVLVQLILFTG